MIVTSNTKQELLQTQGINHFVKKQVNQMNSNADNIKTNFFTACILFNFVF